MELTRDQKADLLRSVELFAGLDAEALASVGDHATEVSYPAGRWIVRQGEIGTGFFLLISGRARVVRDDHLLAELGPGDFFGELALIEEHPRSATVVADTDTDCILFVAWEFTALLKEYPEMAIPLMNALIARLHHREHH